MGVEWKTGSETLGQVIGEAGLVPVDMLNLHDQIIVALIALLGTTVAALVYLVRNRALLKDTAADARAVNDAVNHSGHSEKRIFEQVVAQGQEQSRMSAELAEIKAEVMRQRDFWQEQHNSWAALPPELKDSSGLVVTLHDLRADIVDLRADLAHLTKENP